VEWRLPSRATVKYMRKTIASKRTYHKARRFALFAAMASLLGLGAAHGQSASTDWKLDTISPVANPIYFEDPQIDSEVRPIFLEHRLPSTFHFAGGTAPLGGEIQIFALQLRYALTDRLALIATKDGYIASRPDHTLPHTYGWGNISAGLKYALIDDKDKQFILTPGFTLEVPIGNENVFQGRGSGLWNVFLSSEKGWDKFHFTGNLGFLIPDDFSAQTAQAHYSLQADYKVCQYFIPLVFANGYTILSDGNNKLLGAVNLNTELDDLADFGSTRGSGRTDMTAGAGFRCRLLKNLDLGFACEYGVTSPQGVFKDRFTTDLIFRF
jgi:hypothetical protein